MHRLNELPTTAAAPPGTSRRTHKGTAAGDVVKLIVLPPAKVPPRAADGSVKYGTPVSGFNGEKSPDLFPVPTAPLFVPDTLYAVGVEKVTTHVS